MSLVTLDEAKTHLRLPLTDTADDADLTEKLTAAETIMLTAIGSTPEMRDTIAGWTAATLPPNVRSVILLELGELWRYRGDDPEAPPRWTPDVAEGASSFSPAITALLRLVRPQVLA
jgi:hypothetical protein